MQCRTGEPRQARKGATVARIRMCRRVPGHFFYPRGTVGKWRSQIYILYYLIYGVKIPCLYSACFHYNYF